MLLTRRAGRLGRRRVAAVALVDHAAHVERVGAGRPPRRVDARGASQSAWADDLRGYDAEIDAILNFEVTFKSDGTPGTLGADVIVDDALHEITGYFAEYWLLENEGRASGIGYSRNARLLVP